MSRKIEPPKVKAPPVPTVPPPPRPASAAADESSVVSDDTSSALPVISSSLDQSTPAPKKRRRSSVLTLAEGEIAAHMERVSSSVDPAQLTDTEKNCILQITAFVLCNHIGRYYFLDLAFNNSLKKKDLEMKSERSDPISLAEPSSGGGESERKVSGDSDGDKTADEIVSVDWPIYPRKIDQSALTERMVNLAKQDDSEESSENSESRTVTASDSDSEDEARELAVLTSPPESRVMEEKDLEDTLAADSVSDGTVDRPLSAAGDPASESSSRLGSVVVSSISSALGISERSYYQRFKRPTLRNLTEYRTKLCSGDLIWARQFFDELARYLQISEDQMAGVRDLLEGPVMVDPSPLISALKWSERHPWRYPLILAHFSIGLYGFYSARVRAFIKEVLLYFHLDWQRWLDEEKMFGAVLRQLLTDVKKGDKAKGTRSSWKRWAKIGTAGVLGGAAIAFTGGLAAPAVAVGFAALGLTSAGAFLATSGGAVTLTALFGAAGAGYTSKKAHNRLGDVSDFNMARVSEQSGLSVVIGVSGWIDPKKMKDVDKAAESKSSMKRPDSASEEKSEVSMPEKSEGQSEKMSNQLHGFWMNCFGPEVLDCDWRTDCYAVEWQRDDLFALGKALRTFAKDAALSGTMTTTAKVGLGYTAAGVLLSALTWPLALLSVAEIIDNPWGVCMSKARDAGKILADTLEDEENGHRPITLVGYSVGARVVFYALEQLAKRLETAEQDLSDLRKKAESGTTVKEADMKTAIRRVIRLKDSVENAVLLGAPCSADPDRWRLARSMVSDRLINCYAGNDWVLKFVYRGEEMTSSVAGLSPVKCSGVDNVDVSSVINRHIDYFKQTPIILSTLIDSGVLKL